MTKVTSKIAAGLAAVPYLALLAARERAALAARCVVRSVRRGVVIFEEGAPATGLWVVLAARVRTFARLIEDLALRDVTARVARFLLAAARRRGGEVIELPGARQPRARQPRARQPGL